MYRSWIGSLPILKVLEYLKDLSGIEFVHGMNMLHALLSMRLEACALKISNVTNWVFLTVWVITREYLRRCTLGGKICLTPLDTKTRDM